MQSGWIVAAFLGAASLVILGGVVYVTHQSDGISGHSSSLLGNSSRHVSILPDTKSPSNRAQTPCPCTDAKFCNRITDTTRKEIFVFSLNPQHEEWRFYDWDKVTTVVMVGYLNMDLVCLAHKYGARAVTIGAVSESVFPNATARAAWIQKQLKIVQDNYLDGINFDYESALLPNQSGLIQGYTELVAETNAAFKKFFPGLQVTVDVAWSPNCIDLRCYDYIGLATASDFLFVMAYDEQSQIRGKCVAGANSGYPRTMAGIDGYLADDIPAGRLVLGVPWYGYYYPCLTVSKDNECSIKPVPFRGVYCSDAAGREIDYSYIIQLLKNSTTGRIFDKDQLSPYFNYKDPVSGVTHQIWYDDPQSLGFKATMAVDRDLRGMGVWNTESLDYLSSDPAQIKAVTEMWGSFPNYKAERDGEWDWTI